MPGPPSFFWGTPGTEAVGVKSRKKSTEKGGRTVQYQSLHKLKWGARGETKKPHNSSASVLSVSFMHLVLETNFLENSILFDKNSVPGYVKCGLQQQRAAQCVSRGPAPGRPICLTPSRC